jgi:hypothetical protein
VPAQVRAWWDRHNLAGAVDVPVLAYTPSHGEGAEATESKFRVETLFRHVNLTIRPEEWMSRDEIIVQDWAQDAFEAMREVGLNTNGVVDRLASLAAPSPIRLDDVKGNFVLHRGRHSASKRRRAAGREPLQHRRPHRRLLAALAGENPDRVDANENPRASRSTSRRCRSRARALRPPAAAGDLHVAGLSWSGRRSAAGSNSPGAGQHHRRQLRLRSLPYPVRAAAGKIVFGYDTSTGTKPSSCSAFAARA